MTQVDTALAEFQPDDVTVRVGHAILGAVPFLPKMFEYRTLDDAVRALYPAATPRTFERARELADGEGVKSALWVANAIDTEDAGVAVYSGLKSAFGMFFGGSRLDALETDPQQGIDAGVKLLALSYIVWQLFPGGVTDRVQLFHVTPAGQQLAAYFAAIEVALPFADNVLTEGGAFLERLMGRYGGDAAQKLGGFLGASNAQAAQGMMGHLMRPLENVVQGVGPHAQTIAHRAKELLPTAMTVADKVAGAVATGADVLPMYRWLGARLAAEACVLVASRGM